MLLGTEPWDTGTTCALGAHPTHTDSPASPTGSLLLIHKNAPPQLSLGESPPLRLHSHTWWDTHTFKGFSLQKG